MDIEQEVSRINAVFPLFETLLHELAERRPFEGLTLGWNCHLTSLTAVAARALVAGGGRWRVSECNPATTFPPVADYMASLGMEIFRGEERHHHVLQQPLDLVADTAFDLTDRLLRGGYPHPRGALEITASGVSRLRHRVLPFGVVNLNDGALKPAIENRHGVGEGLMQALSLTTGQFPGGRHFLVVGYGAVGAGVASYARAAGALVQVVEQDPIRALVAHYDGFGVTSLHEGLRHATVVVTATGERGIITPELLATCPEGTVLANVGHWGGEIDPGPHTSQTLGPQIQRITLPGGRRVILLAKGEPLNIVLNTGSPEPTLIHIATEVFTLQWLATSPPLPPGEVIVPRWIEEEVARRVAVCVS